MSWALVDFYWPLPAWLLPLFTFSTPLNGMWPWSRPGSWMFMESSKHSQTDVGVHKRHECLQGIGERLMITYTVIIALKYRAPITNNQWQTHPRSSTCGTTQTVAVNTHALPVDFQYATWLQIMWISKFLATPYYWWHITWYMKKIEDYLLKRCTITNDKKELVHPTRPWYLLLL